MYALCDDMSPRHPQQLLLLFALYHVDCNIRTAADNALPNVLVCIIAAKRENVSYVHQVAHAFKEETPISGVLIDLDNHYSDIALPLNFVRIVPLDRVVETCDPNEGDIGRPNCVARQQTRDVAVGLQKCNEIVQTNGWLLMLEDDMLPCQGAMQQIIQYLAKLDASSVHTVRFAKFSRAVAFPPPHTVGLYSSAILDAIQTMPSDLLVDGDWGSGRAVVYERGSLFSHIGVVSTNHYRNNDNFRKKWGELRNEKCGDSLS